MAKVEIKMGEMSGGSEVLFGQSIRTANIPSSIPTNGMPKRIMISLNLGTYLETEIWTDADTSHTTIYYNGGTPTQRAVGAANSFIGAVTSSGVTFANYSTGDYFNYMIEV